MRALVLVALLLPAAHAPAQRPLDREQPDGRWSEGANPADPVALADDLRATAAALLADLAEGSTMKSGPRKNAIKNAAMWLRSQQDDDTGRVGRGTGADAGLAAYALASAYTLSRYRSLKPIAWKAAQHVLLECDQPQGAQVVDSATCALALLAAEAASMPVADDQRARIVAAVSAKAAARAPSVADLAARLICGLQSSPAERDQADLDRCAQLIFAADLDAAAKPAPDELALLLATTAFYRVGGAWWDAWSKKLGRLADTHRADPASTTATALRAVTLTLLDRHGAVCGLPRPAADAALGLTVVDDPILIQGPIRTEPPPEPKKK